MFELWKEILSISDPDPSTELKNRAVNIAVGEYCPFLVSTVPLLGAFV